MLAEIEAIAPPVPAPGAGPSTAAEVLPTSAPIELPSTSAQRVANYVQLLVNIAWTMRDLGRDAEAEALFRRVLRFEPGRQDVSLALLHLYGSAEERAAAERVAVERRAAETDPLALFEEGSDLLGAGNPAAARDLLARAAPALAGSGYAEAAWYNLGSAAFKLERWEEAANAFAEASAVHPERSESHFKRGVALFHLGRWGDAVGSLRRALELQPERRDVHYFLAGSYTQLGDSAAAARHRALFEEKR
jgi:tetratricopeptide (TPR) repeat protein